MLQQQPLPLLARMVPPAELLQCCSCRTAAAVAVADASN
jgi:hypothetical protein